MRKLENMAEMLQFEEGESVESKFLRLLDFTDTLVGKQEEVERLRLEGDTRTRLEKCLGGGNEPVAVGLLLASSTVVVSNKLKKGFVNEHGSKDIEVYSQLALWRSLSR